MNRPLRICTFGSLQPSTGSDTLIYRFWYHPTGSDTAYTTLQDYSIIKNVPRSDRFLFGIKYEIHCISTYLFFGLMVSVFSIICSYSLMAVAEAIGSRWDILANRKRGVQLGQKSFRLVSCRKQKIAHPPTCSSSDASLSRTGRPSIFAASPIHVGIVSTVQFPVRSTKWRIYFHLL